ncbi:DUF4123 domain-containing protein [Burkholderia sp. IMCC1007]|uniref:DUF4123 domain-containing protein n=1 Tax=Burkholderia sp. IMCC1007 TaxID=3004104 RepID=UPI0022B557A7|nr:DUF4123 domain-containing protein [Burkholderia sp. IMCC1007]
MIDVPVSPLLTWQRQNLRADEALPDSSFRHLLLFTITLQNWAFRPPPQEGVWRPAYAPGVLDLVQEWDSLPHRAWIWQRGSLDDIYDQGPLLVDATHQPTLLQHALAEWAPIGGAVVIGAEADLDSLADHLRSLVQISLPDGSRAHLDIEPHHLIGWLDALDQDQRDDWLGPMASLLWCTHWGPVRAWMRMDHEATAARDSTAEPFVLRSHELDRFDANTCEHFLLSRSYDVQALPQHAHRSLDEIRTWTTQLLEVAERLYITDDEVATHYVDLVARHPWLLESRQASAILNDLTESPQARLHLLAALVKDKES